MQLFMQQFHDLIKAHIKMSSPNSTGFHSLVCKVCDDYKKRAGFLFQDDGTVVYNCFRGRCTAQCVFSPDRHMSRKFSHLLDVYGIVIPPALLAQIRASVPAHPRPYDPILYQPHFYEPYDLPATFVRYDPTKHARARAYLESKELDDTDYFVDPLSDNWLHVPLRVYENIVGYQSIKLSDKFYIKRSTNTDLIYLPNGMVPDVPIIVEGIVDAKSIPNGIAVLQSTVSPRQAYMLRNCKPILFPDKIGSRFMDVAQKYGWDIIIPDWKEKDANKAMLAHGRIRLAELMRESIIHDAKSEVAKMRYEFWTKML